MISLHKLFILYYNWIINFYTNKNYYFKYIYLVSICEDPHKISLFLVYLSFQCDILSTMENFPKQLQIPCRYNQAYKISKYLHRISLDPISQPFTYTICVNFTLSPIRNDVVLIDSI